MSFNPTRLTPRTNRSYSPPPNSGRTHAQIMAKHQATRLSVGPRTQTTHGFFELAFESDAFTVRREVMNAKNSIGYGLNDSGDRVVVVERGVLFGFVADDNGDVQTLRLPPGAVLVAPRTKRHGFATSGEDGVELTIIETPNYAATWQQLQSPTETAAAAPAMSAAPVTAAAPRRHDLDAVTRGQAQEASETRSRRRAKTVEDHKRRADGNANSIAVEGVNPRPTGIPVE